MTQLSLPVSIAISQTPFPKKYFFISTFTRSQPSTRTTALTISLGFRDCDYMVNFLSCDDVEFGFRGIALSEHPLKREVGLTRRKKISLGHGKTALEMNCDFGSFIDLELLRCLAFLMTFRHQMIFLRF